VKPKTLNGIDYASAFQRGEEKAFTFFFKELYPSLCLYGFRFTKDKPVSEEIASQAFIKIWEKHHRFEEAHQIKVYLYRIVRNDSLKWLQTKKKEHRTQTEVSYLWKEDSERDHFDYLVKAEVMRQLHSAISELPSACRNIFELLYIQGKTVKEVSEQLNLSVSTVKTQKSRGLVALQKKLPPDIFSLLL